MKAFLLLALFAIAAQANFVSYTDDKGTRHIVPSVEEIPEQYREKAKESRAGEAGNVKEEKREAASSSSTATATDASTDGGESKGRGRGFSRRRK